MKVSKTELDTLIAEGLVRSVRHQRLPITVYTYTALAQYLKAFNNYPLLLQCRGLVLDDDYNVVGRGFDKFFNLEEHSSLPDFGNCVEVTEKMDGVLLIAFRYQGEVVYTTRGSFYSDWAISGAELFRKLYNEDWIEEGKSYLFEYIGPSSRIVVVYDQTELIHIAVIDTMTGREEARSNKFAQVPVQCIVGGKAVNEHVLRMFSSMDLSNKEGFVVHDIDTGWRCKIKFKDYVRLHWIITGVSNKTIWEKLITGEGIQKYIDNVPDEFYKFVTDIKADLEDKFSRIERDALYAFSHAALIDTRKEQAMFLQANHRDVMHIVFKMLDGDDYKATIWKQIKPDKYDQPFVNRVEA